MSASSTSSQAPPSQQQLQLAPAPPHYRHPHHRAPAGHQQAHFPEDFGAAAAEFPAYEELAGFPCVASSGGGGASTSSAPTGAGGGSTPHPMRLEDAAGGRDSPGSPSSAELQRPACEFAARAGAGPLPPQALPYPTCLAGGGGAGPAGSADGFCYEYGASGGGGPIGGGGPLPCSAGGVPGFTGPYKVQRRAANIRERKRMMSINTAFEELRCHVPTFPFEKRLSKIDTLRLAIAYIALLREVLVSQYDPLTHIEKCLRGELKGEHAAEWNTSDLTARLSWINWENLGVNPNRRSVLTTLTLTADTIGCHNGTQ
ncbi:hypothetical protein HPB49_012352 [Dermacentor silvarum]|uniref:Uncharacterized protein n=1 Tax=Dermacentor silvarum TaxID=543639 RepID=A0ACB8DD04_DERSI|nr:twist-related protein 1 [Dermacentor silvarum]KAH7965976.1 hypothetical protein HPB49_012352 [Dermacentor silvarum]